MTSKTNTTTKGATTLSSSDERVADGLAFKDATGTYSEFLLIYEEPGPTGLRTCGKALARATESRESYGAMPLRRPRGMLPGLL